MWQVFIFTFALQYSIKVAVGSANRQDPAEVIRRALFGMAACVAVFLAYDVVQQPRSLYQCAGGSSVKATRSELRAAFRRVSMELHPDKVKGSDAEREVATALFTEARACFDLLSDEKRRGLYDHFGEDIAASERPGEFLESTLSVLLHHLLAPMVLFVVFFVATIDKKRAGARGWCNGFLLAGIVADFALAHGAWDPVTDVFVVLPVYQQRALLRSLIGYMCHCAIAHAELTFFDQEAFRTSLLTEIVKNQNDLAEYLASEPWKNDGTKVILKGSADDVAEKVKPANWKSAAKIQKRKIEVEASKLQEKKSSIPWGTIVFVGIMALNWYGK